MFKHFFIERPLLFSALAGALALFGCKAESDSGTGSTGAGVLSLYLIDKSEICANERFLLSASDKLFPVSVVLEAENDSVIETRTINSLYRIYQSPVLAVGAYEVRAEGSDGSIFRQRVEVIAAGSEACRVGPVPEVEPEPKIRLDSPTYGPGAGIEAQFREFPDGIPVRFLYFEPSATNDDQDAGIQISFGNLPSQGMVRLLGPFDSGRWEVRAFNDNTNEELGRSAPFDVE